MRGVLMQLRDYTGRPQEIEPLLPQMFSLIARNMREIAPTGNTLDEDRLMWTRAMLEQLRNPDTHWILLFSGEALAGYTLYRIAGETLHMDEIQVQQRFQGDGVSFPMLLGKLLEDAITARAETLASYANRQNLKSRAILSRLGLAIAGETPRGFQYRGRVRDALAWFEAKYGQLQ